MSSSCWSPPISTPTVRPELQRFQLFQNLPGELRLKIYDHIHALTESPRILKISYSPFITRYTSNTPPPVLLAVSSEARAYTLSIYTHLSLGPPILIPPGFTNSKPKRIPLPIPISYKHDILYISGLSPIFPSHISNSLYHISTSSSRHFLRSLAVDLRVWNELCENGLLGCLAKLKGLREVFMVVEFGRNFKGKLGFLEAPEWRSDLTWSAKRASEELNRERNRTRVVVSKRDGGSSGERERERDEVSVRCVILTRGGEQA